jgi:hypothetical protein
LFGAPYIKNSEDFVEKVIQYNGGQTDGVYLRPVSFQPTFHKWANEICQGLQIHVLNPKSVLSYRLSLAILKASMEMGGAEFSWKEPPYEYEYDILPMKLILGSLGFEKHLGVDFSVTDPYWSTGIENYINSVESSLLYSRKFKY